MAHPASATPTHAELRPHEIGCLLAVDPATAREQLRRRAVDDRETGSLLADAEYRSGNVRMRLAAAAEASREAVANDRQDPRTENVAALAEVVPADLENAANCCCAGRGTKWTQTPNVIPLDKKRSPNPDFWALQLQLRAQRLADYVSRMVAQAPPLTPDQRDRIVALLSAGGPTA